jgi:hypothetical protein
MIIQVIMYLIYYEKITKAPGVIFFSRSFVGASFFSLLVIIEPNWG